MFKFRHNFSVILEFILAMFVIANAILAHEFKILLNFSLILTELVTLFSAVREKFRPMPEKNAIKKPIFR